MSEATAVTTAGAGQEAKGDGWPWITLHRLADGLDSTAVSIVITGAALVR